MRMIDRVREKREEIYAIARKHKAEKLWVFGSCARGEERPDSDIDILVKFKKGISLFDFVGLQQDVEEAMMCSVDAVDYDTIGYDPQFRDNVKRDMVAL